MSRLLTIDNCMDCKYFKIVSEIDNKTGDLYDIYYCILNTKLPVPLFKFKEDEKRTDENFKIPDNKCKLPKKEQI